MTAPRYRRWSLRIMLLQTALLVPMIVLATIALVTNDDASDQP